MKKHGLLLIDDDIELCELLTEYLTKEHFSVESVNDGQQGYEKALKGNYDIIVLDIMLPTLNGIEVLRKLQNNTTTPILMLTAKGDEIDRVLGLELGADDYLPKPCSPRELVARLRAILRRTEKELTSSNNNELVLHDIVMNQNTREVFINKKSIELTNTEYKLLEMLLRQVGKVISKEELFESALGRSQTMYDRSLDMHISHLRNKLGPTQNGKPRIRTIRGVGYLLEDYDA